LVLPGFSNPADQPDVHKPSLSNQQGGAAIIQIKQTLLGIQKLMKRRRR
jgi:hypothetical protein